MLHRVGWLFAGGFQLERGTDFVSSYRIKVGTFAKYQKAISSNDNDISKFLEIAKAEYKNNVVRFGHALILAAITNKKSVAKAIDFHTI